MIAVGAQAPKIGGARRDQLTPPVGQVRGNLDAYFGHQPPGLGDQPLHVLDAHRAGPGRQRQFWSRVGRVLVDPGAPILARGGVGDLGRLFAVVALMRDEVLQDHLLDVPMPRVRGGERLQRGDALILGLADPDENAAREWDLQLARRFDRLQAPRRVLRRRAGVDGLHQPL